MAYLMLLAGDVGGTKVNLAVYTPEAGRFGTPLREKTYSSGDYPNLETIVGDFLKQVDGSIERAYFGVAGPVVNGSASATNLPWKMDETRLSRTLDIPEVRLLNDLAATAHAVPHLANDDLLTLNAGEPDERGAVAVIAPGTGLGEAFITFDASGRYTVHPSEGGHSDFAPTTMEELDFLRYLLQHRGAIRKEHQRYAHVSYERVCSGIGLPNIYNYFRDNGYAEPDWLAAELRKTDDHTPIIVEAALDAQHPCDLCVNTLRFFVEVLAAEAGNLVLKVLATGGVYLGGGIPPRILPFLQAGRFIEAFQRKGRFAEMLSKVPVHIIRNPKAALLGAAYAGMLE